MIRIHGLLLSLLSLAPALCPAGNLPANFTLGKYIPDDAWMYAHGVASPEMAWLEEKWNAVYAELKATGIDKDITGWVLSMMTDEEQVKARQVMDKVLTLLSGVRWGDLVAHEMVFAQRITREFPGFDYIILMRGKPESTEANAAGLVAILNEIASLHPRLSVKTATNDGVSTWVLSYQNPSDKEELLQVSFVRRGDILGVVTGKTSIETIPAMLTGKSKNRTLVDSPRFTEAISLVPSPEDGVSFFDAKMYLGKVGDLMDYAFDRHGHGDKSDGRLMHKIFGLCDFIDYIIVTSEMDGRRYLMHEAVKVQAEKTACPLARICGGRKPFDRFDAYIPADATGFSVDGFLDLELTYQTVINLIEHEIPDGKEAIAEWKKVLESVGFDPERDLFSWWSGETINVTLPASVVTPMSGDDTVTFLRVKNPELAAKKIRQGVDFLSGRFAARGWQGLLIKPAAVDAEGFVEITHPAVAMFLRVVVGVKDDWLILGSSPAAVNKCLAVASNKAPSIMTNARFKLEGLIPTGPVASASFTDTSNWGQDVAAALGGASFAVGMVSAMVPDDPDTKQVKQFMQKGAGVVMKLAPVFRKIDFYSSESSLSTNEGLVSRTERVVTYKPDAAVKGATPGNNP